MALDLTTATTLTIGAASVPTGALALGQYAVTSTTACWVAVGATAPTAAAHAAGNVYVPPNYPILINVPRTGWFIAAIQDAAGGFASIALNV